MGLFQSAPKKTSTEKAISQPMVVELTDVVRRLRMIEERQENLRKKLQMIEQNMLAVQRKFLTETKTMDVDLTELHSKLNDMVEKTSLLVKEIKLSAKKEDVDVLKKYLDYWTPVHFVTLDQVEQIIKDILEEKGL